MRTATALALWITVAVTVCVMWVPARWSTTLPEVAAFGLCAVWAAAGAAGVARIRVSFAIVPLAALLLWAGFQIESGVTIYAWRTKVAMLYWGGNLAVLAVALQVCADREQRDRLLKALVLFGLAMSVLAPLQATDPENRIFFLFDRPSRFWIPFGPFPYNNQYAAFIELLLPVALYHAVADRRRSTFYVLTAAVLYTSVIASNSRAGFALATLEMLAVPVIAMSRERVSPRFLKKGGLLLGGMLLMLALAAGPASLVRKFMSPDPYAGRREFVESSLRMIRERPLWGVGLGNWSTAYPAFATFDDGDFVNQAHNDWAEWAVEGGLPLFGIMLALAVWAIPRSLRTGWGMGVTAIFVHCLVDYPIGRTGVALVFFILLGAVASSGSGRARDDIRDDARDDVSEA